MLIRVRFVFFEVIDTMRRQILRGLKLVVAYSGKLKIYDYDNKHRTRLRRISSLVIDKQSIDTNTKRLPNQREVFSFVINPCSLLLRGP